ncbi:protein-tyrosine phosphatase [Lachnospiraceae bacterium NE2001]|nr:protein-tyrosine phosphatase [Lachnospiraceae bacterium NE2001]
MLRNEIKLPGINNSRELGGYTAGDRTVRSGVLLRTGALKNADPEAIRLLSETYRVQKVIDFRMNSETLESADPEIPGAENCSLSVVEMTDYLGQMEKPEEAKDYMSRPMDKQMAIEIAFEKGLIGPHMYTLFVLGERGRNAYKEFFRILLKADPDEGAILWHCTDGKDRTGIAAALLLTALGADKETVYEDYLLTNEYNAKIIEAVKAKYAGEAQDKLEAMIFVSGGVSKSYMDAAFEAMDQYFGGVAGYLSKGLGLTNADIELLREKYTG